MNLKSFLACAVFCMAPAFSTLTAAPLLTLPMPANTGVGSNGLAAAGDTVDLNYTAGNGSTVYVTNTIPVPAWVAPGPNASWISIDPYQGVGAYTEDYDVTFNLGSGINPANFILTGLIAVDNNLNNIYVNGVASGVTLTNSWSSLTSFTLDKGFVNGLNTIDFNFTNTAGPGGLLVEFESASLAPEPASYGLIGLGLAGLGMWRLKVRK